MGRTVIKVENVSKQYRLGEIGTGTMANDINRWWYKVRGKEDPYLKIGEVNDRTKSGGSDYVWSLRDINFDIGQGDAIGIIGRNGAGKSTLLKILSRVTAPTTGSIKVKGRIASLLEVGTGFHPDLSGRDNIYLNGAILGMRKQEIARKFDEIVDFAGVERYIDTPVKRYSSGMYVRLAFAVAAYLESEILIVDEVLAVGDAEFQKKCLGKMGDVSKSEGRTVLFVSHNMSAVKQLCTKGIILKYGSVDFVGSAIESVNFYNDNQKLNVKLSSLVSHKSPFLNITEVSINGSTESPIILENGILDIKFKGECAQFLQLNLEVKIYSNESVLIATFAPGHLHSELVDVQEGVFTFERKIKFPNTMANGDYYANIALAAPNIELYYEIREVKVTNDNFTTDTGKSFNYNEIGFFTMNQTV